LSWQPRASVAYKVSNAMALHAGGGVFNDIIPAQVADFGATNPPYAPVFVGGINGQVGGHGHCAGGCRKRGGCDGHGEPGVPDSFQFRRAVTPLAVDLNTFPSGTLKTPYFLSGVSGLERELGTRGSLRMDYVGHTRGAGAISGPVERLSDCLCRMLRTVRLQSAAGRASAA
jgi:hypothetical protein